MRSAASVTLIFCFLWCVSAQGKEKVMSISWGDVIWEHKGQGVAQLDTPDKIRQAARTWKRLGVTKVIFRADDFRILLFHERYTPEDNPYKQEWDAIVPRAWESGILKTAVESIKSEGMEVQAWITILDEGMPPEALYADATMFGWLSHFTRANPQYLSCDRSPTISQRKYHLGVLEYAYPEVRGYMLQVIRRFSDALPFDGVFLSLRTHSYPPEHADQFGFNEPVVKEYQRRHGWNILLQSFDLEKWRELRGEYLTQFLREVQRYLRTRNQKLSVGVQQGDYIGPPFGNMKIAWRQWVSEKIVDELVVGHITKERGRYPKRTQRAYGYIQSQEDSLGLPPVEEALEKDYGPLCRANGVRLYVELRHFHLVHTHPAYGSGRQLPEERARFEKALAAIGDVTGYVYEYEELVPGGKEE